MKRLLLTCLALWSGAAFASGGSVCLTAYSGLSYNAAVEKLIARGLSVKSKVGPECFRSKSATPIMMGVLHLLDKDNSAVAYVTGDFDESVQRQVALEEANDELGIVLDEFAERWLERD
jgi:hypothetical protein